MNTHLKQLWAAMKLPKNFKKSYKFFCLGLDIRVPEIMHTNLLYTGFFTSSEHFMVQEMFGVREKSVVIFILTGHVLYFLKSITRE